MKLIFVAIVFLFIAKIISAQNGLSVNAGALDMAMENMTENSDQITDEIFTSLGFQIEGSADTALGNMQVLITNAMAKMAKAFYNANHKMADCPQAWNMNDLIKSTEEKLANCAANLTDFRTFFNGENGAVLQGIQTYIRELPRISEYCELLGNSNGSVSSFASNAACFIQRLAELSRDVGQMITGGSVSVERSRISRKSDGGSSTGCSVKVVEDFVEFVNEAFKNC